MSATAVAQRMSTWSAWTEAGMPDVLRNGKVPDRRHPFHEPLSEAAQAFLAAAPPQDPLHCRALIWDVSRGWRGPWCARPATRPDGWCVHHCPRILARKELELAYRDSHYSLVLRPIPFSHALLLATIL